MQAAEDHEQVIAADLGQFCHSVSWTEPSGVSVLILNELIQAEGDMAQATLCRVPRQLNPAEQRV